MLSIRVALAVFVFAAVLSRPAPTAAQTSDAASLAGIVRDASGGVLPGVTVEVASPVLIDVDLRFTRVFRFAARTRFQGSVDIYNL
jgi:hypothetical protein